MDVRCALKSEARASKQASKQRGGGQRVDVGGAMKPPALLHSGCRFRGGRSRESLSTCGRDGGGAAGGGAPAACGQEQQASSSN